MKKIFWVLSLIGFFLVSCSQQVQHSGSGEYLEELCSKYTASNSKDAISGCLECIKNRINYNYNEKISAEELANRSIFQCKLEMREVLNIIRCEFKNESSETRVIKQEEFIEMLQNFTIQRAKAMKDGLKSPLDKI